MNSTLPYSVTGNLVDIPNRHIYKANLWIEDGHIKRIEASSEPVNPSLPYIMPGFIDSHVHIESSMLVPSEFARLAVLHGTVGTISDPHEIANVLGTEGIRYFLDSALTMRMDLRVQLSSCVPATHLETAGAELDAAALLANRLDVLERSGLPETVLLGFRTLARIAAAEGAEHRAAELLGVPVADLSEAERREALPRALLSIMRDIGIPNGLTAIGYTERDVPALIEGTLRQPRLLSGAPRPVAQLVCPQRACTRSAALATC